MAYIFVVSFLKNRYLETKNDTERELNFKLSMFIKLQLSYELKKETLVESTIIIGSNKR